MSGTALDHPLVQDYLRRLDNALLRLPAKQAGELREQITAHLDDALRPDVSDEDVSGVLRRLGKPEELIREAEPRPIGLSSLPGPRAWRLCLARLSWRGRVILGTVTAAVLAVLTLVVVFVIVPANAAPLLVDDGVVWWNVPKHDRVIDQQADGARETSVPVRSGKRQGFIVTLVNTSGWTQTVVGIGPNFATPGGIIDVHARIEISKLDPNSPATGFPPPGGYTLPGRIPPHQTRAMLVTWTSTVCMLGRGTSAGIDVLPLRVRVGSITRTEVVPLDEGWYLRGPSSAPNSANECV